MFSTDLVLTSLAIFIAGGVRGYAGFGFSAVSIALISLWRPPGDLIPIVLLLEIPASLLMLRQALKDVALPWVAPLVGGSALGIPLGVMALASVNPSVLQTAISAWITIASVSLLRRRGEAPSADGPGYRWITGLVSGVVNGVAALGGIACALMLGSSSLSPAAMRATLTLLFLFTDFYALAWAWGQDLIPAHLLNDAGLLALPLALGIWLGSRAFAQSDMALFRRRVFGVLSVVGTIGLVRGLWTLAV